MAEDKKMLKISLNDKESVEGSVFALDPVTQSLVLDCDNQYRMIFSHYVSKVVNGEINDDTCMSNETIPADLLR